MISSNILGHEQTFLGPPWIVVDKILLDKVLSMDIVEQIRCNWRKTHFTIVIGQKCLVSIFLFYMSQFIYLFFIINQYANVNNAEATTLRMRSV